LGRFCVIPLVSILPRGALPMAKEINWAELDAEVEANTREVGHRIA
jgi:hypothetical protein